MKQEGFFWIPPERVERVEKRTPPARTWERPDYLPGLAEARAFRPYEMSPSELVYRQRERTPLAFDVECFYNWFLVGFRSRDGQCVTFEMRDGLALDIAKLGWVVRNFPLIGFNSRDYDLPIVTLALAGADCQTLKEATNQIIHYGARGWEMLKHRNVPPLPYVDHVDLIEVAPLQGSLKAYNGRLHGRRMHELPFPHDAILTPDQMCIGRHYNYNDLESTWTLDDALAEQRALRNRLTMDYGIDLRSKSDAQIAEAVISTQVKALNGGRIETPNIAPGTSYRYIPPAWLSFQTQKLCDVFATVLDTSFVVNAKGRIELPPSLSETPIAIGQNAYRMGIGGLHSTEESCFHRTTETTFLSDRDVASYYPLIMLLCKLYPRHLGVAFLQVYQTLVDRRLAAKKAGDKSTADSLKITINGTFGKLGNPYSAMYAPNLMMQVTLTGQLALLMLIERVELAGFQVVSANTDGITIKGEKFAAATLDAIVKQWEAETGFETEETKYVALYSADVNNYVAVKPDGTTKGKGRFSNPWADPKLALFRLHKNPVATICVEAIEAFLVRGTPIAHTIRTCADVRKFVSVRKVDGGAVKVAQWETLPAHTSKEELIRMAGGSPFVQEPNGTMHWMFPGAGNLGQLATDDAYTKAQRELRKPAGHVDYLGKVVRWYYSVNERGTMIAAKSGNNVPESQGARVLAELPDVLPDDVDFGWYENQARRMLTELGL